jgi:predicted DNA-binding transcriptional regulator YafY
MKNRENPIKAGLILHPGMKQLPPELLFYWLAQPRNPVLASPDPLAKMFIEAMLKNKLARFIYAGGSAPGASRSVHVSLVFQHEPGGRIYVAGYCPERSANRVFALDLIMVISARN